MHVFPHQDSDKTNILNITVEEMNLITYAVNKARHQEAYHDRAQALKELEEKLKDV